MGLFGKAMQLVSGSAEAEGLSILKEAIAELEGTVPDQDAVAGAVGISVRRMIEGRVLRVLLGRLGSRGVVSAAAGAEGLRMISTYEGRS